MHCSCHGKFLGVAAGIFVQYGMYDDTELIWKNNLLSAMSEAFS